MYTDIEPKKNTPAQSPLRQVAPGVYMKRILFVNILFIGEPGGPWWLVDAGLPGYDKDIREAADLLYGPAARPEAILLTHGHFDHIGSLEALLDQWSVPVFAHHLEQPYLNGTDAYPMPDPTVGGGVMPVVALSFPRGPIDINPWLQVLPEDGTIPGLEGWQWLHTPGHAPGHVSFWREADKTLIAGDAVVCTRQESAYMVATQTPELNGPPKYFTPDWQASESSVRLIADLQPEVVVTGHGPAMEGEDMRQALRALADNFKEQGMPKEGRYVDAPATFSEKGVEWVPPLNVWPYVKAGLIVGLSISAIRLLRSWTRSSPKA